MRLSHSIADANPILNADETRKRVQKYSSDNIAFDKELRVALPSHSTTRLAELSRKEKTKLVIDARIKCGNDAVLVSFCLGFPSCL